MERRWIRDDPVDAVALEGREGGELHPNRLEFKKAELQ